MLDHDAHDDHVEDEGAEEFYDAADGEEADGDEAAARFNAAVAAGDAQAGGLSMASLPQKTLR